jgi:hypothetical protein
MRFAAVVRLPQPVRMMPPPAPARRPVPDEWAARTTQPPVPQPQEVPVDLDQRVRLAGEW